MADNRDYDPNEVTKMSVRTWPDPKVRDAERRLEESRVVMNHAERRHLAGLTARQDQERAEQEVRNRGYEPHYQADPSDLHEMMAHDHNLIRRWISDEDLTARRLAFEAARTAFQEAEAAYDAARAKGKPISETTIRSKAQKVGARYAVNKELTVAGTRYGAGQPIPDSVIDQLDHWKVRRWLDAALIREV